MKSYQNKVVLVTGAAKRLGAAIVRTLHGRGARVMIHHRGAAREAQALARELNGLRPASAACVKADLLAQTAPRALVAACLSEFGRLDALVNNASSFYPTPMGRLTARAWDDLLGSNLRAPLFLAQAAAAELRKRRGAIVNIVDIHAEFPLKDYVLYTAAKGGLLAATRALACELAPAVRVNGVSPGPILWPASGQWRSSKTRQAIVNRTLLKRTGTPQDIAGAVAFLLCDAPYVTGQVIAVDGGRSISL